MIVVKNRRELDLMRQAGILLAQVFESIEPLVKAQVSTLELEEAAFGAIRSAGLVAEACGYRGYRHATCISINDEVVHGVPRADKIICDGDIVKIDICSSLRGYCADMARSYVIGTPREEVANFVNTARSALDIGIAQAVVGARLSDVSAAIQQEVERGGYSVVRDFAGHGIGKAMHEDPEILNYGKPGCGPVLRAGMTLAIEPMITMGDWRVFIADDGWTVRTKDGSLAAHVEDTIVITEHGPEILTRVKGAV